MKNRPPKDMASSVRQRLLNISKRRHIDYQWLLTRYGLERFLYRLSQSKHRETFVLKGALLFLVWDENTYRPTRDADLLGKGDHSLPHLKNVFQEIFSVEVADDGIIFDFKTVKAAIIKEDQEYEGIRVTFEGKLGRAKIPMQVDIGFGDTVSPAPQQIKFPTLLDFSAPIIKAYPPETVIAEKFQAMVQLGIANSRMKDFYDVWFILTNMSIDNDSLKVAIEKTFKRRKTELPKSLPFSLSDGFFLDSDKQNQWNAFLNKNNFSTKVDLQTVILKIRHLLPLGLD